MPAWLNFGVGKGLLCSQRLSWVICFAAAKLLPDCRAARGCPSSHAPTVSQGCPARATIAWPEAGGGLVLHVATEPTGPWPPPGKRARGSPPHCATKSGPPRWLGTGQSRGHGTSCHYLHLALLGSSIVADSAYRTSPSCPGSSAHLCSQQPQGCARSWGDCLLQAAAAGHFPRPRCSCWGSSHPVSAHSPGRVSSHVAHGLCPFVPL